MLRKLWGAVLALPLVLTACTSTSDSQDTAASSASGAGYAVVTHGGAGDAFWTVVKTGTEAAGKQLGVKVSYESDGDPQKQAQLIDAAVNKKVDGLVLSMANPDALRSSVQKAVKAGIPVVTINSGQEKSSEFGAVTHVGQDETIAGEGAGKKLREAGVKHLICIVHEAGNVGLEQRCAGARQGLGAQVDNLQVDINNVQAATSTIQAKLQSDPSVDGVLALNPSIGTAAMQAGQASNSKARIATFDLSEDVVRAIEGGQIQFAVDQQQYLQGYLPIVLLQLYRQNLNTVGGGKPVLTGPGFVTRENAAEVAKLAGNGTR